MEDVPVVFSELIPSSESSPALGEGELSGWEPGARPSPTPGAGLSLDSPPTAGHRHLPTHSPVASPTVGSLDPEQGPAVFLCSRVPGKSRGHLARCTSTGVQRCGVCPALCSCLTLPFPGPSPLQQLLHFPLFLLPGTFRLFRVQCSERGVWLSSHQATGRNTDEKLAQRETGCLCRSWGGGAPNPM